MQNEIVTKNTPTVKDTVADTKELKSMFSHELEMLDSAKPKKITFPDIGVKLGSPWLPKYVLACFMRDYIIQPETAPYYLKDRYEGDFVTYDYDADTAKLNPDAFIVETELGRQVTQKFEWSFRTQRYEEYAIKRDGYTIRNWDGIVPILNELLLGQRKTISRTIWIDDDHSKQVVDETSTATLREYEVKLEKAFKDYLASNEELIKLIEDTYNEKMNRRVVKQYNGEMISVDGLAKQFKLRDYQKNAVMRIVQTGRALLAHEVGMGKTLTMLASAFKLKDLGIANRPCIAVPSALVEQFGRDALKFFPTRKVLVADKSDFTAQNRRRFYTRIMNSNFDVIIMSHEQFQRISLSPDFLEDCLKKQKAAFENSLVSAKSNDASNTTVKAIQSRVETYKRKLEELKKTASKYDDGFLFFEDLGIDFLFVDEAHYFKNYVPATVHDNIRGMLTNKASARAEDMLFKCQYLHSLYGDSHVVFATGTPVSNTVGEMWVMENYIQPDALKEYGTASFDEWVNAFGNITTSLELNTTGNAYRAVNRLSDFCNLPELMTQYRESADIRLTSQLDPNEIKIPRSKHIVVLSDMTDAQEDKFEELICRTDKLKNGKVDPSEDNMLKITHEARTATLDLRLLDSSYQREDSNKLDQCADNLVRIYKRTDAVKGTQIVFSDMGTPKGDGRFSAYEELKEILMEKGIPEEEIAFVHDFDTASLKPILQEKMNSGQIRILIGSTSKGGTGFNVQKRVKAIHHLDVPWKPADIIQRNGRGVRNGNIFEEVEIYSYITKGSFDNYLWQIQEQKLKYITEIMTARDVIRAMHDEDEETMTASQFKAIATGDPYMKERMTLENNIKLLLNQKLSFDRNKSQMFSEVRAAKKALPQEKAQFEALKKDLAYSKSNEDKAQAKMFELEFADGMRFEKSNDAANHLRELLRGVLTGRVSEDEPIASYRGYMIYAFEGKEKYDKVMKKHCKTVEAALCREGSYQVATYPDGGHWTGVGVIRQLENRVAVKRLSDDYAALEKQIQDDERLIGTNLNGTFSQQARLDYSIAKLNTLVAAMDQQAHKEESEESQEDGQHDEEKSSQEEIASQLADFDKQWQADHPDFQVAKNTVIQSESDEEIRQKYLDAVNNYNDALFDEPADESQESEEETEEAEVIKAEAAPEAPDEEEKPSEEEAKAVSKPKEDSYTPEELAEIMSKAVKVREREYQLSLF